MIQGPVPGSYYKVPDNRVTTVGRSSRNVIRVITPTVSRFHCEISCVNGEWVLTDLNSKKGTIVNGQPVVDRTVLRAGDTLRLSSVLFRFDMLDETVDQDDMMLAVHEAGLGQKLRSKGRASSSLAAIRARTRMAAEAAREKGKEPLSHLRVNAVFVGAVGLVVALLVSAVLIAASRMPARAATPERARRMYDEALAALQAGNTNGGRQLLEQVQADFPDSAAAALSRRMEAQIAWGYLEQGLARVTALEAEGDYAAALEVYDGLDPDPLPEDARDLVQQRRDYTVRLAHAAFRSARRRAETLMEQGDREAARQVLMHVRDSVGVPGLAAQADAEITDVKSEN